MTSRQKLFLLIAASLLAIKFVVQPLIESQNESINDLQMSAKRLSKVEPLVERADELRAQEDNVAKLLDQLKSQFPVTDNDGNLRVAIQRNVEQAAASKNVELNQFDWLGSTETNSSSLLSAQFGVKIIGDLNRVVGFHNELLDIMGTTRIQDFQLRTFIRRGKRVSELNAIFVTDYLVGDGDE